MAYDRDDYWRECVEIALSEAGVTATPEQIKEIAWGVQGGAENIGQAFYTPSASDRYSGEIDRLKRELRAERDKVICETCKGRGRLISYGPYHSSDSQCYKCSGEGRHKP
jgi:hypothetical protein